VRGCVSTDPPQAGAGAQMHATDLIEPQLVHIVLTLKRVDVHPVLELVDDRARGASGVLDRVATAVRIGSSLIQQIIASNSRATVGASSASTIMSPREMSISSSRRSVTDIDGKATSSSPS